LCGGGGHSPASASSAIALHRLRPSATTKVSAEPCRGFFGKRSSAHAVGRPALSAALAWSPRRSPAAGVANTKSDHTAHPAFVDGARGRPERLASSSRYESDGLPRRSVPFFFFSREEERLHIHVQSADGEAKFWIEPEIELARNYQLSDQDLSRVLQLVVDHEQEIRDAWHRHFGR
jgi:hypothetical protein